MENSVTKYISTKQNCIENQADIYYAHTAEPSGNLNSVPKLL